MQTGSIEEYHSLSILTTRTLPLNGPLLNIVGHIINSDTGLVHHELLSTQMQSWQPLKLEGRNHLQQDF